MVRVVTSKNTASVNPNMQTPHRIIKRASSQSSAGHFRCRCRWMIRARLVANSLMSAMIAPSARKRAVPSQAPPAVRLRFGLLNLADQIQQLHGVRTELLGELVLDGCRRLGEARLVHVGVHLYAQLYQLLCRLLLKFEAVWRFELADLSCRRLDPLLLFDAEPLPGLVADPNHVVVCLVLRDVQHGRHLVVLVG